MLAISISIGQNKSQQNFGLFLLIHFFEVELFDLKGASGMARRRPWGSAHGGGGGWGGGRSVSGLQEAAPA